MRQCSALQPLWWCGGTVRILSSPLLPPCYLEQWTDARCWRGGESLGDKSLVLSVTLFLLLLTSNVFAPSQACELYRVMYARNPLYLHEGTYLHNLKCSLLWQKCTQTHTQQEACHTYWTPSWPFMCTTSDLSWGRYVIQTHPCAKPNAVVYGVNTHAHSLPLSFTPGILHPEWIT